MSWFSRNMTWRAFAVLKGAAGEPAPRPGKEKGSGGYAFVEDHRCASHAASHGVSAR